MHVKTGYELTNPQKLIYDMHNYLGYGAATIGVDMMFSGSIDLKVMNTVLNDVCKINDALRIRIDDNAENTKQYVDDFNYKQYDVLKFNSQPKYKQYAQKRAESNVSLKGSLIDFTLIVMPEKSGVFICLNHIVGDASSLSLISKQICSLYKSYINHLEKKVKAYSYIDYIEKEKQYINSKKYQRDKKYWTTLFNSNNDISYSSDNANTNLASKRLVFDLDKSLNKKINSFCRANSVSEFSLWMSAIGIYFKKTVRDIQDFFIGTTVLNRFGEIEENTAGMFVNTIPLLVNAQKGWSVKEILSSSSMQIMSGFKHQKYNYGELLREIKNQFGFNGQLFDVMLSFQNISIKNEDNAFKSEWYHCVSQTESLVIHINDLEEKGISQIIYDFKVSCYLEDEISLIHNRLCHILNQIVSDIELKFEDISVIDDDEKHIILQQFNNTDKDYDTNKTIIQMFEKQVKENADKVALILEDRKLTYEELNNQANSLATKLRTQGVKQNDLIVLLAGRSLEMIIGIYAILKAGGAYVPVDPTYPSERIEYIVSDCKPKVILTTGYNKNFDGIKSINIKDYSLINHANKNLAPVNNPDDLAYCIYTSGTTGRPKGVIIEHRNVCNLVNSYTQIYDMRKSDVMLQFASVSFDQSVLEIFLITLIGGTLCLLPYSYISNPRKVEKYMTENKVSVAGFTPAYINELNPENIRSLRMLESGGSSANVAVLNKWLKYCRVFNTYGPTEATVNACTYEKKQTDVNRIPIGKPMDNCKMYILSGNDLCGVGIVGELCITGRGLARGYLNQKELTSNKFVKNPFGTGKMYRTGDLAKWLPDGNIEYIGRIDHQVKIRGFRIELGEIESIIKEISGVKDAVVMVKQSKKGDKVMIAYVCAESEIEITYIKSYLKRQLPVYMVPSFIIKVDKIPLTKNGKVDKTKLPEIDIQSSTKYIAPRNETEKALIEIFKSILEIDTIGVQDNFFEMGGHSLRATRVLNCIEQKFGVRLLINDMFQNSSAEELAKLIKVSGKVSDGILKASKKEYYKMSSSQRRMYMINEMDDTKIAYNMPAIFKVTGEIDILKLKETFKELTNRHEALRTSFNILNGEYIQEIQTQAHTNIEYLEDVLKKDIAKNFVKPFSLQKAPLMRIGIAKTANKECYIMFDMHHIISDGMSVNIIIKEFCDLYNGKQLNEVKWQYKDYSEWMLNRDFSKQKEYWVNEFSDEIPSLDMPYDYKRTSTQSYNGNNLSIDLPMEIKDTIKSIAFKTGATEYMIMLSALMIMLGKYSRQEKIIIGSPVSGRVKKETEEMVGIFVNTLAIKGEPKKDKKYTDFIEEIKKTCINAYENQEYPFEELIEEIDVQRDSSKNPLVDVMLSMQNNKQFDINLSNVQISEMIELSCSAKFDITVNIDDLPQGYKVTFNYCCDLYEEKTVLQMMIHYKNILSDLNYKMDDNIANINMYTEMEQNVILNEFNNTKNCVSYNNTVIELFESQVKKTPYDYAVAFKGSKITYLELNNKANLLAESLQKQNVKPNDFVAIYVERSIEMIIGIIGILKAGGAYVPIDPVYPIDRVNAILSDCRPKAILTYKEDIDTDICKIDLFRFKKSEGKQNNLNASVNPEDSLYVIYTSGTTGVPKGVVVKNNSFINMVNWYINEFKLSAKDNILLVASIGFDLAQKNIFAPLISGGCLYLYDQWNYNSDDFTKEIYENRITLINCAPSVFYPILYTNQDDNYIKLTSLKYVFLGGEVISMSKIASWQNSYNCNTQLINTYGPTECTDIASFYRVTKNDYKNNRAIPIGQPIPNVNIYVLDESLNLLGVGVPGELCIAGAGVSKGYWEKENLNKQKFLDNPFGSGKLYKTGDLVKWRSDGNIEFIGRIDQQVKIRGFRIELQEIENVIKKIEAIKNVAIVVKDDKSCEKCICAYIVSDSEINLLDLRQTIKKELPEYMVPSYIMQIDKIPTNVNGKLDKKALPEIEFKSETQYIKPVSKMEKMLCHIFEDVLNIDRVGVNDNFFELGGHSLKATKVLNQIEKETGIHLTIRDIFSKPTVGELSSSLLNNVKLKNSGIMKAKDATYYLMSPSQKQIFMICQMDNTKISYNMPIQIILDGHLDKQRALFAFKEVINNNEILRTRFYVENSLFVQKVAKDVDVDFTVKKYNNDEQKEFFIKEFVRPFSLDVLPLIRMEILEDNNCNSIMLFDMHHIISDGKSINIFINEFSKIYNGETLPQKTLQYKDYCSWLNKRDITSQKEYWISEFNDDVEVFNLPLDFNRPVIQSYKGASMAKVISLSLKEKIQLFARKNEATEYMVLLSVLMIILSKYSRQDEIIIGTPVSGRTHEDAENIMGMFVNTLAIKSNPEGKKDYSKFLQEIKNKCLIAIENQEFPFEELIQSIGVKRDISRNPLFDVMFAFQNNDSAKLDLDGVEVIKTCEIGAMAKCDLTLNVVCDDGYKLIFEYCEDLFKEETIDILSQHYINVLKNIVSSPEIKIKDIGLTSLGERELILNQFNSTDEMYPHDKTMADLFEMQVQNYPNNTAVVFKNSSYTYSDLNERANRLAHRLRNDGVKPNDFVAIIAKRNLEMIVAVLGVLKSGGAYVPIDAELPECRIRCILDDCKPKMVLLAGKDLTFETDICTKNLMDESSYSNVTTNPIRINSANDLAYCIFTSGTTGKPKGVLIEHYGVANLRQYFINQHNVTQNDNVLQFASFSFDAMISEMTMSLFTGATMYIVPQRCKKDIHDFEEFIKENNITIAILPPQFLSIISLKGLRTIITAGAETNYGLVVKNKHIPVYSNDYGPTEATVCATYWKHNRSDKVPNKIPIGKPINNKKIYILDGDNFCGIGVAGELCIAGVGLARGYLNRPELTKEKFVVNPFGKGKMYRTGDLAKWLPDGNIEYLGRIDEQVKIRGFRVELLEIENVIRDFDYIKDVAVICVKNKNNENVINAYIVSQIAVDICKLRAEIGEKLPDYMIPNLFMQINKIPVTHNGKLDKKKLPEIKNCTQKDYIEPKQEQEKKIASVFEKVLDIKRISTNDEFFELGGDSLKAVRAATELKEQGIQICVNDIMRYQTIEKIYNNVLTVKEKVKYEKQSYFCDEYFSESEFKKSPIYNQATLYEKKNRGCLENNQSIGIIQKGFILNNQICSNKIVVNGEISKEEICQMLSYIIKTNKVLRSRFSNNERNSIGFVSYNESWYIPYIEDNVNEKQADSMFNNILNYKALYNLTKNLVYPFILKLSDDKHIIYIAIHHCVWDNVSAELLVSALKNYQVQTHTKSIKEQKMNSFYNEFCKSLDDYKSYIKGLTFSERKLFEYSSEQIEDEKLSTDIMRQLMSQFYSYSLTMNEKITKIPFMCYYHGRNNDNRNDMGMYLKILPAIYDVRSCEIIGGINYKSIDIRDTHKFDDILYDNYYTIPVVNVRTIFEDNYDINAYQKNVDNISVANYVTADINNNRLFISLPKYNKKDE